MSSEIALLFGCVVVVSMIAAAAFYLAGKRRKMAIVEAYYIKVPKDQLQKMPREERTFMLMLGASQNQVSMLQKLLMFSSNHDAKDEHEKMLSAAQTQMLLRLTIGVLHESWLLIEKNFIKSGLSVAYESKLDQGGKDALQNLKRMSGKSNLISSIRNRVSFHFDGDLVEQAFSDAYNDPDSDDLWTLYFSQFGFNSFFMMSDLMMIHGIAKLADRPDMGSAQQRLMDEVTGAVGNLFEFSKAFFAAAWIKNFGVEITASALLKFPNPQAVGEITLPFFVDMNSAPARKS